MNYQERNAIGKIILTYGGYAVIEKMAALYAKPKTTVNQRLKYQTTRLRLHQKAKTREHGVEELNILNDYFILGLYDDKKIGPSFWNITD